MGWLSLKTQDSPRPRVFISVPKKIVPLAVDRNRIKRLIREAVRRRGDPPGRPNAAFQVLQHVKGLKLKDVQDEIHRLIHH